MSSSVFGRDYRDPYADLVVSQLIRLEEALAMSRPEYEILLASVRSHILTSPEIRTVLQRHVKETIAEIRSARQYLLQSG